jgi:hypothetical protein
MQIHDKKSQWSKWQISHQGSVSTGIVLEHLKFSHFNKFTLNIEILGLKYYKISMEEVRIVKTTSLLHLLTCTQFYNILNAIWNRFFLFEDFYRLSPF